MRCDAAATDCRGPGWSGRTDAFKLSSQIARACAAALRTRLLAQSPGGDQTLKGHQAKMQRAGLVVAHTSPCKSVPTFNASALRLHVSSPAAASMPIHVSFQNECSHGHHFGVRRARSSARLARRSYSSAIRSILCLVSASLISSASTRIPSARSRHVVGSVNKDAGRGITALSDWEFPRL